MERSRRDLIAPMEGPRGNLITTVEGPGRDFIASVERSRRNFVTTEKGSGGDVVNDQAIDLSLCVVRAFHLGTSYWSPPRILFSLGPTPGLGRL